MKRRTKVGSTNRTADMKWMIWGMVLLVLSCNGQKKSATEAKTPTDQKKSDERLTLISSDSYSGSDVAETLIIKDSKSLQKFYAKINRTRKPGLPVPSIDFSRDMVVIRCSGKQNNTSIPHLYIREESEKNIVLGIEKASEQSSSPSITNPFSVYKMPLTLKHVSVEEKR